MIKNIRKIYIPSYKKILLNYRNKSNTSQNVKKIIKVIRFKFQENTIRNEEEKIYIVKEKILIKIKKYYQTNNEFKHKCYWITIVAIRFKHICLNINFFLKKNVTEQNYFHWIFRLLQILYGLLQNLLLN